MKKFVTLTSCLTLCLFLEAKALTGTYSGGAGTVGDPAQISSIANLLELSATEDDYGEHFILTTDLNLSGQNFTSAVIAKDPDAAAPFQGALFTGSFDGNGHIISNLTINASAQPANDYLGLFGYIEGTGAELFDLTLANISITTGSNSEFIGGLCGSNDGKIRDCAVSGTITTGTDSETCGGLCGHNMNLITNCQSSVALNVGSISGGLCGINQGVISDCSSSGSVSVGDINIAGAFCGKNEGGTIHNSAASGSIVGGTASINIGGFCGFNDATATITQCRSSASTTGNLLVGGLCGSNLGLVSQCYTIGPITIMGNNRYGAGGLIGENGGTVTNSYSAGSFTLLPNAFGVGGLIGADEGGSVSNSFWNIETSGQATSGGGTGLTTTPMQTQATFTTAGWDFSNVWTMDGYPIHIAAAPPPAQVVSIEVDGSISIMEETTEEYSCMAFYTDGSSNDVTQTATWSVIPADYASIDTNGLLSALSVPSNRTTDVQAVYTDADGSYTNSLEILIAKAPPEVSSIHITGPYNVAEESNAQYTCLVLYADGSSSDVSQTAAWSVIPPNLASIDSNGVLTTSSVSSNNYAIVQAVYADANGSNTNWMGILIINHEGFYSGGGGTEQSPFLIANKADLLQLRNATNDYQSYFALTADIDLTGEVFIDAVIAPGSSSYTYYDGVPFRGSFDGQGYIISNLLIDVTGLSKNNFLGLFGRTAQPLDTPGAATQTVIRNLAIENVSIFGGETAEWIGGLVGQNDGGIIYGCTTTGTITGGDDATYWGGLCGENTANSIISNCQTAASVSFGEEVSRRNGGLVGLNSGTITDCSAVGSVLGGTNDSNAIGGLCGQNQNNGRIIRSYSTGSVFGNYDIGGLCGHSIDNSVISNCYATSTVKGRYSIGGLCGSFSGNMIAESYATGEITISDEGSNIGGLVGNGYSPIIQSYATGNILCNDSARDVGGFCGVGGNAGTFSNCYSTSDITITGETYNEIGGFCGYAFGQFTHCYSAGTINLGTSLDKVGGFIGISGSAATTEECFWNTQTSGLTTSAGGTGKTTAEMQAESSFNGWDFNAVWYMHGYPELQTFNHVEPVDYFTWADAEGIPLLERGPEDTPAGDGIPNIIKYAAGLPAMTSHLPEDVMSIATVNEDGMFSIIYSKSKTAEGAELLPVWAGGLDSEWVPEGITHELIAVDGDVETWKVSIPLQTKGFMKLQIALPQY